MNRRLFIIAAVGLLAAAVVVLLPGRKPANDPPASTVVAKQNGMARLITRVVRIDAAVDKTLLASSGLSGVRLERVPATATIGVYYPESYKPGMAMPVLFAMSPGAGSGISGVNTFIRFAEKLGFIIAAVQIPEAQDVEEARYYYMLHAIDFFRKQGILLHQPAWIGGVSGGAKWALQLGAWGGSRFDGIIAIDCNEDFATLGFLQLKDRSALDIPICLINGSSDELAGIGRGDYMQMIWTMKQTGFKPVKIFVFDGGHTIPEQETIEAFEWLKQCYDKKKK
jgi:predicted esterase